jgi:DNA-binding MarR family transcriptional regulator
MPECGYLMPHFDLNGAARRVLQAIEERESVLVSDIRKTLEMSQQLPSYQLSQLGEQGLIKRVTSVAVDTPKDAHLFHPIPDGQTAAADADARAAVDDEIRELRKQIDHLETLNNRLWDRIEDADIRIDAHETRLDNHKRTLYTLCDQLDDV